MVLFFDLVLVSRGVGWGRHGDRGGAAEAVTRAAAGAAADVTEARAVTWAVLTKPE